MKYKLIDKTNGEIVEVFNGIEELLENISTVRLEYILDSWIPTGLYNQVEGLFEKLKDCIDDDNKYLLRVTDPVAYLMDDVLKIIREEEGKLKTALDSATDFVAELHGICEPYTYKGVRDNDNERYFDLQDAINKFYITNKEVLLDD